MAGLIEKRQSIEDILFEIRCLDFFKKMKIDYKHSELGFLFEDLHKCTKKHFLRMVKKHEKDFGEKLTIKMLEVY